MDKGKPNIPTTPIMKDNGLMENTMEKESLCGLMALPMKENMTMAKSMELALSPTLPKKCIKDNGKMGNNQV